MFPKRTEYQRQLLGQKAGFVHKTKHGLCTPLVRARFDIIIRVCAVEAHTFLLLKNVPITINNVVPHESSSCSLQMALFHV